MGLKNIKENQKKKYRLVTTHSSCLAVSCCVSYADSDTRFNL